MSAKAERRWCILQVSGPRTLPLARALIAADFDAWTPVETQSRRRPRSKKMVERVMPIMPTFVFVRSGQLDALVRARAVPNTDLPGFRIFQWGGRVPEIADDSIAALRAEEAKLAEALEARRNADRMRAEREAQKQARKLRREVSVGAEVNVPDSAFRGVTGVVESSDGRDAWVRFGKQVIKVDAWRLLPSGVSATAEAA